MPILPAEFWANVGDGAKIIIVLLLVLGVLGLAGFKYLGTRIEKAGASAQRAAELSGPTGNGFATGTTSKLNHLVELVEEVREDVALLKSADRRLSARLSKIEKAKAKTQEETHNG